MSTPVALAPHSSNDQDVERLGHASAKITWDIYQHVTPTMQADAAETVARLIFGPSG
jgi:integrase